MMMYDLPLDLVEEILSRVPATSMKRLRSTCKRWNALFKDQRFIEKHLSKAPKESMVLMLKEYKVFSMSINLNVSSPSSAMGVNLNVAPPSIEFKGGRGLKDSHSYLGEVDIVKVLHCHGLLLCITKDNRSVVWNPCLGETRWIQPKTSYKWYYSFALGYEKNKSGYSYKILMWWWDSEFEIYEFSSDSWRVLDNVALDCFILSNIGVSLEGNSYWLAQDEKDKYYFILSFDFTAERFKRMCLPPLDVDGRMSLSVVGEKKLSLLSRSDSTPKKEIWITNKIDTDIEAVLKWSKSFTVDKPMWGDFCSPLFFCFSIDEEKKVVLCSEQCSEIGNNKIHIIGEDGEYYTQLYAKYSNKLGWYPFIFSYVPSLVQIRFR